MVVAEATPANFNAFRGMTLGHIATAANNGSFAKGLALRRDGAVRIVRCVGAAVEAVVKSESTSASTYAVLAHGLKSGVAAAKCTCVDFRNRGGLCKHGAAVLVELLNGDAEVDSDAAGCVSAGSAFPAPRPPASPATAFARTGPRWSEEKLRYVRGSVCGDQAESRVETTATAIRVFGEAWGNMKRTRQGKSDSESEGGKSLEKPLGDDSGASSESGSDTEAPPKKSAKRSSDSDSSSSSGSPPSPPTDPVTPPPSPPRSAFPSRCKKEDAPQDSGPASKPPPQRLSMVKAALTKRLLKSQATAGNLTGFKTELQRWGPTPLDDPAALLHAAVAGSNADGALEIVRALLDRPEGLAVLNAPLPGGTGRPPLHAAVVARRPEVCKLLLEVRAEAEAKDGSGHTAMDIAQSSAAKFDKGVWHTDPLIDVLLKVSRVASGGEESSIDFSKGAEIQ